MKHTHVFTAIFFFCLPTLSCFCMHNPPTLSFEKHGTVSEDENGNCWLWINGGEKFEIILKHLNREESNAFSGIKSKTIKLPNNGSITQTLEGIKILWSGHGYKLYGESLYRHQQEQNQSHNS